MDDLFLAKKMLFQNQFDLALKELGDKAMATDEFKQSYKAIINFSKFIEKETQVNIPMVFSQKSVINNMETGAFANDVLNMFCYSVYLFNQQEFECSIILVRRIEELIGRNIITRYALGILLSKLGELETAEQIFETLYAETKMYHFLPNLAKISKQLGQHNKSKNIFSVIQANSSKHHQTQKPDDQNGLNNFLLDDTENFRFFGPIIHIVPKDATFLDVGCNNGARLEYLYKNGFRNCGGLEINPPAVKYFKHHRSECYQNSKITVGDVSQTIDEIPDQSFDVVYSSSVLSALYDDEIIEKVSRKASKFVMFGESDSENEILIPCGVAFHNYKKIMENNSFCLKFEWRDVNNPSEAICGDVHDRTYALRIFERS